MADTVLERDRKNSYALFARAMASGLMADYTALVEHRYLAASKLGKAGLEDANALLNVDPAFYDAHIWPGVTNFIAGSLPFPLRWLAKLRGFPTDEQLGIARLQLTAERGTLLRPYAKILPGGCPSAQQEPRCGTGAARRAFGEVPEQSAQAAGRQLKALRIPETAGDVRGNGGDRLKNVGGEREERRDREDRADGRHTGFQYLTVSCSAARMSEACGRISSSTSGQ
jgi:hypothetical protein